MTLKRSEMIEQINLGLGSKANITPAVILPWLNFALQDTAAVFNWRDLKEVDESIKTVVGKDYYAMPKNTKDIMTVTYKDAAQSYVLRYLRPDKYRQLIPAPEVYGTAHPLYYTWEPPFLRFYPLISEAGKTIEIYRTKWPEPFNLIDDVECPIQNIEQGIIARAIAIGARWTGENDKMQINNNVWQKQVKRFARPELYPTDYTPIYGAEPVVFGFGNLFDHPRQVAGVGQTL